MGVVCKTGGVRGIALRRAGRSDTTVFIPHPNLPARKDIFEIGLTDKPCRVVVVAELAAMTDDYASAERKAIFM
ncbi:MAG: hypothetical protein U9Q68_11390 [Euryarchaeota archaeon]|nr:hypothetical protein [Euryarchaeota archaeon]